MTDISLHVHNSNLGRGWGEDAAAGESSQPVEVGFRKWEAFCILLPLQEPGEGLVRVGLTANLPLTAEITQAYRWACGMVSPAPVITMRMMIMMVVRDVMTATSC